MLTINQLSKLISKYDKPVPRYTSFPTAVNFHPGFGSGDYIRSLGELGPIKPVSIYVHIPFCHQLCYYCGCHTKITHKNQIISNYINLLVEEIKIVAGRIPYRLDISRIHFGGGSPNYASIRDISKILDYLKEHFNIHTETEIDMECDPRLLCEQNIKELCMLGVGRVSLGVQDFDIKVQKAINRIQSFELIAQHTQVLRREGIKSINFDLITGLPEQTSETIQDTIDKVIELRPDRIAVFSYAHVPWIKKHQKILGRYTLPPPSVRFSLSMQIRECLKKNGYKQIGIDHYGLPNDKLSVASEGFGIKRNFQGYSDDQADTIIGFGLSAISQFSFVYAQNTVEFDVYSRSINQGQLPTSRGIKVSREDSLIRDIIMALMCLFEADISRYPYRMRIMNLLEDLQKEGLVELKGNILALTELGRPFVRTVAAVFDPYYEQSEGNRHARAV